MIFDTSMMCIDIKPEGDSLLRAISSWLSITNEQQYTMIVFDDLMIQISCGLVADPKAYAMYIQSMPSYEPFRDLEASWKNDTANLSSVVKEVGMSIFFKLSHYLGSQFTQVEVIPKHITTNSLYLTLYRESL